MPGLGQLYCRQWGKGAGFLIGALVLDGAFGATAGLIALTQGLAAGLSPAQAGAVLLRSLPLLAVAVWSVVDAVKTAKTMAAPAAPSMDQPR
jgi:hypothetical protein